MAEEQTEEEGVPVISMGDGDELTMEVEELDYEEIEVSFSFLFVESDSNFEVFFACDVISKIVRNVCC